MFVYAWADGIYSTLRGEDDRLCLLILIGVNEQGEKRLLALSDGYRESPRRPGWASSTTCKCVWGLKTPPPPPLAVGGRRPEVLGGLGRGVAANSPPALPGPQDGQRAQCLAEIRPGQGQSGVA